MEQVKGYPPKEDPVKMEPPQGEIVEQIDPLYELRNISKKLDCLIERVNQLVKFEKYKAGVPSKNSQNFIGLFDAEDWIQWYKEQGLIEEKDEKGGTEG